MKKTIILALAIISMLVLVGCGPKVNNTVNDKESGITVTGGGEGEVTTTGEGKEVTITGEGGAGPDWCQAGANWQMTSTEQMTGCKVVKLVTSGEYKGLCNVVCTMTMPDGQTEWNYWFDESGENGYVEMDIDGQKVKHEWHS